MYTILRYRVSNNRYVSASFHFDGVKRKFRYFEGVVSSAGIICGGVKIKKIAKFSTKLLKAENVRKQWPVENI